MFVLYRKSDGVVMSLADRDIFASPGDELAKDEAPGRLAAWGLAVHPALCVYDPSAKAFAPSQALMDQEERGLLATLQSRIVFHKQVVERTLALEQETGLSFKEKRDVSQGKLEKRVALLRKVREEPDRHKRMNLLADAERVRG